MRSGCHPPKTRIPRGKSALRESARHTGGLGLGAHRRLALFVGSGAGSATVLPSERALRRFNPNDANASASAKRSNTSGRTPARCHSLSCWAFHQTGKFHSHKTSRQTTRQEPYPSPARYPAVMAADLPFRLSAATTWRGQPLNQSGFPQHRCLYAISIAARSCESQLARAKPGSVSACEVGSLTFAI